MLTTFAFAFAFAGCESKEGETADIENNDGNVYLSVTRAVALDADGTSINTDSDDYEDRVHDLAMLAFDSSTGAKVAEYYEDGITMTGSKTFVVRLTPGTRDFYFIANMGMTSADGAGITNVAQMKTYMNNNRELDTDTYLGATLTKGYPMSRVYTNQTIDEGGSIYQPLPYRPTYIKDGNPITDNKIILIRVVAKLEVILTGEGVADVAALYFRNANRHYYLVNPAPTANPSVYHNDKTTNTQLKQIGSTNTYAYYMPEGIFPSATWVADAANKPINFFTIEMSDGTMYDIPIISNETVITTDYLKKARGLFGGFTPNYNIVRNDLYRFTVGVPALGGSDPIEVIYSVKPWNDTVVKQLYMGYGYNVEIDNLNNVTVTNTVDDCMPHKVILQAINGAYFGSSNTDVTREYGYESASDPNYDAAKAKSDYYEGFGIVNNNAVSGGQGYLEVWYNGELVKTFYK